MSVRTSDSRSMPAVGNSTSAHRRPLCPCGCGESAAPGSIYATYACRARAKQRHEPAPRVPEAEQRRRLAATGIRSNPAGSHGRPVTAVVRTRELGEPSATTFTPPQVCGGGQGACRCGCGRPVRRRASVYAEPLCKRRVARRQYRANVHARRTGAGVAR